MDGNGHVTDMFEKVQKAREQLHRLDVEQWVQEVAFTWEWWLLVGFTFIPLVLWWKFLDKKRAFEIALYGCLINIMAVVLDIIGTNLSWWSYPVKLTPLVPPLLTADSILVPIAFMIAYQRFAASWKRFWLANLATAALIAFMAEPVFIWIGYYKLYVWKLVYSFLFYIVATSLARLILTRIAK